MVSAVSTGVLTQVLRRPAASFPGKAALVEMVQDVVSACAGLPGDYELFVVANHTALPAVRKGLMELANRDSAEAAPPEGAAGTPRSAARNSASRDSSCASLLPNKEEYEVSEQRVPAAPSGGAAGDAPSLVVGSGSAEVGSGHLVADGAFADMVEPLRIVHLFPELLNLYGDGATPGFC